MVEIENVRVVVRVRPLSNKEIDSNIRTVTKIDQDNHRITVTKPNSNDVTKSFLFDYIYDEDSTQTNIYRQTARPIVEKVLKGYNGTVFAYGQTGTGKTYTMNGLHDKNQRGIIPNTFFHIFSHIAKAKDLSFLVHVTYMEIYNENVRDLLVDSSKVRNNLEVRQSNEYGVFVKNLSGYIVHTLEELERLLIMGEKNRSIGSTYLNYASSRSHTIFTITVESNDEHVDGGKHVTKGKLQLVDLAGSERQSKTQTTEIRFKEATKINQSLSVLGNVISALIDGNSSHIPYRNSKLTRLLQDSLGGNSKTIMITTISPAESDYEETISTLRYANRAKNIQNHTYLNEQSKDTLLQIFQNEIADLRKQLESILVYTTDISIEQKKHRKSSNNNLLIMDENLSNKETENTLNDDPEFLEAKTEQEKILEKLQQLNNKIIIGGVNLLEKAESQELLIKVSDSKLQQIMENEEKLKQSLQQQESVRIDIEERYATIQEEIAGKSNKLEKLTSLIKNAKNELADLQQEHRREMETISNNIRETTKQLKLAEFIVNKYIPVQYQAKIERNIHWNENIGDFQLKCKSFTGNKIRQRGLNQRTINVMESPIEEKLFKQYPKSTKNVCEHSNHPKSESPR